VGALFTFGLGPLRGYRTMAVSVVVAVSAAGPRDGSYSASVGVFRLVCGLFRYVLATRDGGLLTAARRTG
jgi:hypothetical protein